MEINRILRYFDINSKLKPVRAQAVSLGQNPPELHWLPQWLALAAGIWIQPFFEAYRNTHHWHWEGGGGRLLFAAITAVIIFPTVYRRLIDQPKPLIILLAPCFVGGLGYESLLATAVEGVGQVTGTGQ